MRISALSKNPFFRRRRDMRHTALLVTMVMVGVLLCPGPTKAGNDADVEALVKKAVAMCKEKGLDATLRAVNDLKGPFVKGNLYVFAMSMKNKRLAAGSRYNKHLLGTTASEPFSEKMLEIAKSKGSGWIEYSWPKPNEKTPSRKKSFVMKAPGEDAYFGAGFYLK
jgi:hypothetical protein